MDYTDFILIALEKSPHPTQLTPICTIYHTNYQIHNLFGYFAPKIIKY